ncbi:MAG: hypothetical protein HKP37_02175 [Boseongicola sp.]|nr:hypothetical protein [Boseongicola sp.]NNL17525.1 hypothetical protein [Boseongicola sp.]
MIKAAHSDALLIMAPRFLECSELIEQHALVVFKNVDRRSRGEKPDESTDSDSADAVGKMGLR